MDTPEDARMDALRLRSALLERVDQVKEEIREHLSWHLRGNYAAELAESVEFVPGVEGTSEEVAPDTASAAIREALEVARECYRRLAEKYDVPIRHTIFGGHPCIAAAHQGRTRAVR